LPRNIYKIHAPPEGNRGFHVQVFRIVFERGHGRARHPGTDPAGRSRAEATSPDDIIVTGEKSARTMVGAGGPLASIGGRVAKALDDFREHHRYRTFLCHGSSEIAIDRSHQWTVTLHLTSFRSRAVARDTVHPSINRFEEPQADQSSSLKYLGILITGGLVPKFRQRLPSVHHSFRSSIACRTSQSRKHCIAGSTLRECSLVSQ
jgi:hypothetical protein